MGGDLSASVTAKRDVVVDVRGSVTGAITAGEADTWAIAFVSAGGNVSGEVKATWGAEVLARGKVSEAVTGADGYARVVSGGSVTGAVSSTKGEVGMWGWDGVAGAVSAADRSVVMTCGSGPEPDEDAEEFILAVGMRLARPTNSPRPAG